MPRSQATRIVTSGVYPPLRHSYRNNRHSAAQDFGRDSSGDGRQLNSLISNDPVTVRPCITLRGIYSHLKRDRVAVVLLLKTPRWAHHAHAETSGQVESSHDEDVDVRDVRKSRRNGSGLLLFLLLSPCSPPALEL